MITSIHSEIICGSLACKMCDKCSKKIPVKYWLHIADGWTKEEKLEMIKHLVGEDYLVISQEEMNFLIGSFPYPSFYLKSLEKWLTRLKKTGRWIK